MKFEMIMYVAQRELNEMMRCFDLKPDYKWYVTPMKADIENPSIDKIKKLIAESHKHASIYIPAVRCGSEFVVDEGVMELSDGKRIMYVNEVKNEA